MRATGCRSSRSSSVTTWSRRFATGRSSARPGRTSASWPFEPAICSAPPGDADPGGRYAAAVINGLLLITFGVAGATATAIMLALPTAVIGVAAGLAMIPALLQALRAALAQDRRAYGAFFALVIAASDVNLLGVGAPFWSLVGGLVISRLID